MTTLTAADILEAALKLPSIDRERIAMELLARSPAPAGVLSEDNPGFLEELDRRAAALESGADPGVDPFEAIRQIEDDLDGRLVG